MKDEKECFDRDCQFILRRHVHVNTNNGSYIKYIDDKPKQAGIIDRSNDYADTRR